MDDHILGLDNESSDDEDLDNSLISALNSEAKKASYRDWWRYAIPVFVITVGILFTFGYFMGVASTNDQAVMVEDNGREISTRGSDGQVSAFIGGNKVNIPAEIERLNKELMKEKEKEQTMQDTIDDLTRKWAQMAAKISRVESLEQSERRLEQREEKAEQQLAEEKRNERAALDKLEKVEESLTDLKKFIDKAEENITASETNLKKKLEEEIEQVKHEVDAGHTNQEGGILDGTKTEAPQALLDFDLVAFRNEIEGFRHMLVTYWKGSQVLENTMYLRPGDQRYEKGVEFIAEKMARALVWGDTFTIGAMGSSVTAGHDNCNFDSYERQMERNLAPLFQKAKVKFTVRNAGEGGSCGDSFRNQIWCVRHMLGDDIDVAHYSWTYFEPANQQEFHEMWIRWVLMMDRAPVPQLFNTGGEDDEICKSAVDSTGRLFDMYGKYGMNVVCLQNGIKKAGYPGKQWGAIGDGTHSTTRYGEASNVTEARRKSLGVVFRNWHPGPLGFQVVSDAFSYHYTYALLKAIDSISEFLRNNNNDKSKLKEKWKRAPTLLTIGQLPKPAFCEAELCSQEDPPGCTNWEIPTYGRGQVRILDPRDSMNPFKDQARDTDKGWKMWKDGQRQLIPKEERNMDQCLHLDVCAGVEGRKDSGLLTLRLPRMDVGRIMLCSPAGKEAGKGLLDNLDISLDGQPLTQLTQIYGKCILAQERWTTAVSDSKGHLHLGVRAKTDEPVRISHVVVL